MWKCQPTFVLFCSVILYYGYVGGSVLLVHYSPTVVHYGPSVTVQICTHYIPTVPSVQICTDLYTTYLRLQHRSLHLYVLQMEATVLQCMRLRICVYCLLGSVNTTNSHCFPVYIHYTTLHNTVWHYHTIHYFVYIHYITSICYAYVQHRHTKKRGSIPVFLCEVYGCTVHACRECVRVNLLVSKPTDSDCSVE